jgi:deazaflavin-dependent oxidoreductase (nitroreductase family)
MPEKQRNSTLLRFLHAPVLLYGCGLGWVLGRRFLLLTHTGRRTGVRHQTVLEVMEYRDSDLEIVVMSGFGRNANWLRNIEAASMAEIDIGSHHFTAAYRLLPDDEAIEVVRGYERRNRFMGWIVRLVLSRLLGWKYRGSDSDHQRLVEQLPLIAFRPRP